MVAGSQRPSAWRAAMARRSRSGPLLGGDATEEEEALAAGDGGVGLEKSGGEVVVGFGNTLSAEGHHHLMALVEPEGLAGKEPLRVAGEADGIGLAQGQTHSPGPKEPFLEVLEGITATEPGVQHAVGKDEKGGSGAAHGQVGGEEMEIPDTIHHHGVVIVVMSPNPAQEGKGKKAINPGAAQGLDGHFGEGEVGRTGGVEGGDLQGIAEGMMGGGYLPDRLNRSTTDWIYGLNDVENPQGYGVGSAQFGEGGIGRCASVIWLF
jgi:hypothetical protein